MLPDVLSFFQWKHLFILLAIAITVVLLHKRNSIRQRLTAFREERQLHYLPLSLEDLESSSASSWIKDIGAGFTSKTFNLISENLMKNDQRSGLDENAKNDVKRIMDEQGLSFDEARLLYTRQKMGENDIGEDGVPNDPRLVRFS